MCRWIKDLFKTKKTKEHEEDVGRVNDDSHLQDGGNLWYPEGENIHKTEGIKMPTRGEYPDQFPSGFVVHFTSGWAIKRGFWPAYFPRFTEASKRRALEKMARDYALRSAKGGAKSGYNFLTMDIFGKIYQSRPFNKHGYHAGSSTWRGIRGVSSNFGGVEILSPGKVKLKGNKYMSWFGLELPQAYIRAADYNKPHERGYYATYTKEQEESLIRLSRWLIAQEPFDVENLVGHDEVSPGRKNDPGGSLSMPMCDFRKMVAE